MFNFLLGVAESKPVTKEDLLEFENSVYSQMKDVQDVARNVQADQISFLTNNFTIFLTILGLILAVVAIVATYVFNRIKKNSDAAKNEMNKATDMMKLAEEKTKELDQKLEQVDRRLEDLNKTQVDLKTLLNSKELDQKINNLEAAAETTTKLDKQIEVISSLQYAQLLVNHADETYTISKKYYSDNPKLVLDSKDAKEKCTRLNMSISNTLHSFFALQRHGLQYGPKVKEKVDELLKQALEVHDKSVEFFDSYVLPVREKEIEEMKKAIGD
ncbi:hypothetical protein [Priestia megaterium]|uniref:hypothetical protein n=1 Tax=Priestia TaxID=2800373 RepID=UPI003671C713